MLRSILIYGGIAGLVIISINTFNLESGRGQVWLGFLVMFIAFSTIYIAVKQHRDNTLGGVITFRSALGMGLGIAAVAGVVYVAVWEVYLAATGYNFIEDYISSILAARRAAGVSEAEIASMAPEMEQLRAQYANPLVRLPMTFLEVFPPGLLVALVSAATLRNHGTATRNG